MQRYRFDRDGTPAPNGSIPVYSEWMFGPSLAGIRKCPCEDGKARTVYIQREPDTLFSIPAAARIAGKYTKGFVMRDDDGYAFIANKF